MSVVLGHTIIRNSEGKIITNEEIVFTPQETIKSTPYDNVKEEYKNLLKRK